MIPNWQIESVSSVVEKECWQLNGSMTPERQKRFEAWKRAQKKCTDMPQTDQCKK